MVGDCDYLVPFKKGPADQINDRLAPWLMVYGGLKPPTLLP